MTDVPRRHARTLLATAVVLGVDLGLLVLGVGGWRAFLHHPRAQALYAVWVLGTIALAWLRPFRGRDAVETARERWVLLALFLVPAATPALSAWAERAALLPLPGGAWLRDVGLALAAAGYALRIAAMRRLGVRFSPLVEVQRRHALETGGPYARIRHPGYLGALLGELGVVLTFGSAATLPLAVALAIALGARIRHEEETLARHFGADWHAYRARTGALLPRLGRVQPARARAASEPAPPRS
ncbi:MAG TPA: isoprenylcysteine carboxylmethyltransferase family protein [Candidatus Eisenbacteria bacterium]|nr:isoprenylcysteine carboxylmethyltransferase family protein [Candidatus Eisenbacteria bacterium]